MRSPDEIRRDIDAEFERRRAANVAESNRKRAIAANSEPAVVFIERFRQRRKLTAAQRMVAREKRALAELRKSTLSKAVKAECESAIIGRLRLAESSATMLKEMLQ